MGSRTLAGAVALLAAGAFAGADAGATSGRTYVPNCGNTSYLAFKPAQWSAGCTAGSLNMPTVRWNSWGRQGARGAGTAMLREPCPDEGQGGCPAAGVYRARARLVLSLPRTCRSETGRRHRYFSRARLAVRYRAGNPFGSRPGWHTHRVTVSPDQGLCTLER